MSDRLLAFGVTPTGMPKLENSLNPLVAQAQQTQPPQPPQTGLSTDFFASVGLMGTVLLLLVTALAKGLPNYMERFFASKELESKTRLESQVREQTSDLQREEAIFTLLTDTIKSLREYQLQTSQQFRDEFVSQMAIQGQQLAVILNDMGKSLQNQERFFQLAMELVREIAELRIELERIRKTSVPSQSIPTPKLPVLPPKQ
jgi:hypothetical protein